MFNNFGFNCEVLTKCVYKDLCSGDDDVSSCKLNNVRFVCDFGVIYKGCRHAG